MSNVEKAIISAEEVLRDFKGSDYNTAIDFHEFALSLGLRIEAKNGTRCNKIVYSIKKPKRSLFTIEDDKQGLRIKANLFNIQKYKDIAEQSSSSIKESIKKTKACTSCNARCAGHPSYILDGEEYLPCYGSGHYFHGLSESQWKELMTLIEIESKASNL